MKALNRFISDCIAVNRGDVLPALLADYFLFIKFFANAEYLTIICLNCAIIDWWKNGSRPYMPEFQRVLPVSRKERGCIHRDNRRKNETTY